MAKNKNELWEISTWIFHKYYGKWKETTLRYSLTSCGTDIMLNKWVAFLSVNERTHIFLYESVNHQRSQKEAVDMYNVQKDLWICRTVQYRELKWLMIPECVCSHRVTLLSSLHSPLINIINMLQLSDLLNGWRSLSNFSSINVYIQF